MSPATPPSGGTHEEALDRYREERLDPKLALAKFALLRWDELKELAFRLAARVSNGDIISIEILRQALNEVADLEWRKNKSYLDFIRDIGAERRDFQMLNIWEVKSMPDVSVPGVLEKDGSKWLTHTADSLKDIKIAGFELVSLPSGGVEIRKAKPG